MPTRREGENTGSAVEDLDVFPESGKDTSAAEKSDAGFETGRLCLVVETREGVVEEEGRGRFTACVRDESDVVFDGDVETEGVVLDCVDRWIGEGLDRDSTLTGEESSPSWGEWWPPCRRVRP